MNQDAYKWYSIPGLALVAWIIAATIFVQESNRSAVTAA